MTGPLQVSRGLQAVAPRTCRGQLLTQQGLYSEGNTLPLGQEPLLPLHTHQTTTFLESSSLLFLKSPREGALLGISSQSMLPASTLGTAFWADPGLLTTSKGTAQKASLFNPILSYMPLFRKERSKVDEDVLAPLSLQSFSVVNTEAQPCVFTL